MLRHSFSCSSHLINIILHNDNSHCWIIICTKSNFKMIIGHLPLGYISTKIITAKWPNNSVKRRAFIIAGLLGSIIPDFDMIYFYLFDNCQHHHHTYWIHIPFYWCIILGLSILVLWFTKKEYLPFLSIFGINIFIHLFVDTIVGDIWWLYPLLNKPYSLFSVPALYNTWWVNFILHWSFIIEIIIMFVALYICLSLRKKKMNIHIEGSQIYLAIR